VIARISTELEAPAETIWALLKRTETLLYVTRGVLGLPAAKRWPADWRVGDEARGRLWFFHVIPGWEHRIRPVAVDESRRELLTNEQGGIVKVWNHRLWVEPLPGGRSRYTDEIAIEAGLWTPPVWAIAHLFYRYRQARWRGLARVLA